MSVPRKSPWAAIDALPQSLVSGLGIVGIAELANADGEPFVRVFCSNVSGAVEKLPGSMNGFPVEISECGKNIPPEALEGLRQIRHYNVMADPGPVPPSAPQYAGQVTDMAQTVTQPITDAITSGYDLATGAYDSITGTISSASSTLSAATSVTDAAQSAYQSQQQAAQNALALQRALAAQSASKAGQQVSGAASNLGAIVILSALGIAAVIWLSRK